MSVLRLPLNVCWPHCQRSTAMVSKRVTFTVWHGLPGGGKAYWMEKVSSCGSSCHLQTRCVSQKKCANDRFLVSVGITLQCFFHIEVFKIRFLGRHTKPSKRNRLWSFTNGGRGELNFVQQLSLTRLCWVHRSPDRLELSQNAAR